LTPRQRAALATFVRRYPARYRGTYAYCKALTKPEREQGIVAGRNVSERGLPDSDIEPRADSDSDYIVIWLRSEGVLEPHDSPHLEEEDIEREMVREIGCRDGLAGEPRIP
jgi:hypothetical protein